MSELLKVQAEVSYGSLATKGRTMSRTPSSRPLTNSHTDAPPDAPTDELYFNQGRLDFAQARDRCARAVRAYNNEYLDATEVKRVELWLDIVDPARVRLHHSEEHPDPPGMETRYSKQRTPVVPEVRPGICMDYGLRVRIDPKTFINTGCTIVDTPVADVTIGPGTNLGPNVSIYSVGHSPAQDTNGKRSIFGKPVTIEGGCWIGGGTIIMPGVTIGAHTTIGAGSIVTRSIPSGVLAYGQPARVIRSLDRVADGPPAAFFSARALTLGEALQLGVDGTQLDEVCREAELLELAPPGWRSPA